MSVERWAVEMSMVVLELPPCWQYTMSMASNLDCYGCDADDVDGTLGYRHGQPCCSQNIYCFTGELSLFLAIVIQRHDTEIRMNVSSSTSNSNSKQLSKQSCFMSVQMKWNSF